VAKQRNINIVYKVNTQEVAAAKTTVDAAKKATDALVDSTKKYETATSAAYKRSGISIQDMNVKLQSLRQQIIETNVQDTKRLDTLLAKYKVLSADVQKYNNLLREQSTSAKGMETSFSSLYNMVRGGIYAVLIKETVQLIANTAILQGKIEGVKIAFDKLPGSTKILNDMRKATQGMLTDYNLMTRALQAKNFKIPLEEFSTLLEFATIRAQQTGQEVDYLVDSIVRGIGMQSVLRLDNLGISAARLREQFKGVSIRSLEIADVTKGVTEVIKEEMKEMGGYVKTSETSVGNLTRAWQELYQTITKPLGSAGGAISDFFTQGIENLTDFLKGSKVVNEELARIAGASKAQAFAQKEANKDNIDAYDKEIKAQDQLAAKRKLQVMILREELKEISGLHPEYEAQREQMYERIKALTLNNVSTNEYIKILQSQRREIIITGEENKNLSKTYNDLLKEIDEQNELFEAATDRNDTKALKNIGDKIKALNAYKATLDALRQEPGKEKETSTGKTISEEDIFVEDMLARNEKFIKELDTFEKEWAKTTQDIGEEFNKWYDGQSKERIQIDLDELAKREALDKKYRQAKKELEREAKEFAINAAHDLLSFALYQNEEDFKATEDAYAAKLDAAGNNERAKRRIEKEFEKEKIAAQEREKERNKKNALIQIAIDTAANAVRALGVFPVPNFAMAGIALGYGLIQAATVRKFKDGVIDLNGPGNETSDSIPARLSRGESVMTAKETDSSKGILQAIRARKLDDRIFDKITVKSPSINVDVSPLAKAMEGNRAPDLVRQGDFIYEMKTKGKNTKRLIRSKSFSM
jgi:hypothetical protein